MMKYRIEKEQIRELEINSTLPELAAECSMLLNAIYSMLARQGKAADMFKQMMQVTVMDNSPVRKPTPFGGISMAVPKRNAGRAEP